METNSLAKSKRKGKSLKVSKKEEKSGIIKIESNLPKRNHKSQKRHQQKGHMIYLGHIPHGFYENEMTSYFNQFGKVLSANVARSKKTGRSKGYGFVQFADEEVAKIAAETMNNYLMFNRIIKCSYIPPEECSTKVFLRTIQPWQFPRQENRKMGAANKLKALKNTSKEVYRKKAEAKINKFKKLFEEKGINYTPKGSNPLAPSNKVQLESDTSIGCESEDETNDQFGVLEIDESDDEIHFKTPPQVKKIIKKSLNSPVTYQTELSKEAKSKVNQLKNSGSKQVQAKISKQKTIEKVNSSKGLQLKMLRGSNKEKIKLKSQKISQKLKKKSENNKKLTLIKSLKAKDKQGVKAKSLKKGVAAFLKEKKENAMKHSEVISIKSPNKEKAITKDDLAIAKGRKPVGKATTKKLKS